MTNCLAAMKITVAAACILHTLPSAGAVLIPPESGDRLSVQIESSVEKDAGTHLYSYSYEIYNDSPSLQELWMVLIEVQDEVYEASTPHGWSFDFDADDMEVSWAATDLGPDVPDDTDAWTFPPSPYQINPGEHLDGFSFKSASPPQEVRFFAQGYKPVPVAESEEDFEAEGYEIKRFKEDSYQGTTVGPMSQLAYTGNRRPAVDGFLGFTNVGNKDSFNAPIVIGVKFALGGETVDRDTFSATLNRIDVTSFFVEDPLFPGDLVANFDIDNSPLQLGENVLRTFVTGIVPGTNRSAADTDDLRFTVY